ncbi:hypothetical protein [Polaribacter sp. Asnod6-C07]|uniref:hypothetical protein n=1 Tax=Polaribacter sp. Asnod6-C07 TaxID=3160582 RepID=UPI00386F9159
MKIKLLIIILFFCSNSFAQEYPKNTRHIKTIQSTVYNKKDTLNHRELVTYYDKDWNPLTNTNTLSSALDKGSKTVTILDTDKKFVQAIITSKKDTLDYIVYLYDNDGNRTNNYQIRKGDTITDQKRIFDNNGNSLELYNKKNGEYYLRLEAKYNNLNKVTSRDWYNPLNQLVRIEKFEYSEDGKTSEYYKTDKKGILKLQRKTVEIGLRKYKINHYTESKGINYGITLEKQKGYYTIEKKDENDNLISLEIFNKRGKLKTSVYITYSEIQQ